MLSPANTVDDLRLLLDPLRALPIARDTEETAAKVYAALLLGQPRKSIEYAVDRTMRDATLRFRPTPAQFSKIVLDHAKTIELKLSHLSEAIAAHQHEEGAGA